MRYAVLDNQASCFKHCPRCGHKVVEVVDNKAYRCGDCGFVFYQNVAAATVALIEDSRGRLLVTTRAHDPAKGMLDLPGGFVDPNETLEQALIREVKEELNLVVIAHDFLFSEPNVYYYKGVYYHTIDAVFRCSVQTLKTLTPMDDVADVQFLDRSKLVPDCFGLSSIQTIIKHHL